MKKRYIIGGILGVLILLMLAGNMAPTKEVLVGTVTADDSILSVESLKLPDNATSIRVVYDLNADGNYGIGANGNIGTCSEFNSGQDPFINGLVLDSEYLSADSGNINGELTFSPDAYFVYSGMFNGEFKVYATVPA